MKNIIQKFIIIVLALSSNLFFAETAKEVNLNDLMMKNAAMPYKDIVAGGQPSVSDLEKLKAQGVKNIINLRGAGEFRGFDEAAEAKKLGLNYVSLEISGSSSISIENANKLNEILKGFEGDTLVHCASSNRVGALFAIRAAINGKSEQQAMSEGFKAGMKSLSNKTRAVIQSLN